jgi:hypothetical protein
LAKLGHIKPRECGGVLTLPWRGRVDATERSGGVG